MKRLPFNYKEKKTPHIVYYDVENIHDRFIDNVKRLKVHECNLAFHQGYQTMVDGLVNKSGIHTHAVHHVPFKECEKDKADKLLLKALQRDLSRYSNVPNITYVLCTNDKGLQESFKRIAIQGSAFFRLIGSPQHH